MINQYGAEKIIKVTDNKWFFHQCVFEGEPFHGRVSLANGTEFTIGAFFITEGPQQGRLFLAIEYKGAYTFDSTTYPSYVGEKLGLGASDAKPMADFINNQFGNPNNLHFTEDVDVDERFV